MINNLKNKKLLILGASASEIPLVNRAKELGIYVIVTDNNKDWKYSPAKYIADEAWDISWSDLDTLSKLCKDNNIDGITAGYSEFRCENLIKLTSLLKKPCYLTSDQLEITRDKIRFKKECIKYGIPTIPEYKYDSENIDFPVIVKPVDRGGSIGIKIAKDKSELDIAYNYAMDKSVKKEIIIEKFIENNTKVDLYYAIEEDKIELLSSCDTIHAGKNKGKRVVQSAWLYPTRTLANNFEDIDKKIKNMIRGMNIKHGCIFFSGFLMDNLEYYFFECGFRLEGAHQYGYVERSKGINYLDFFIYNALLGKSDILLENNNENNNIKSVVINIYAKEGIIKNIEGIDEISKIPNCTFTLTSSYIGKETSYDNAILDKVCMFSFCSESAEELKKSVDKAYSMLKVLGEKDENLIYDKINTSEIIDWWKNK